MAEHPPGRKTDWWRCARCRGWFGVNEPMHSCYSGRAQTPSMQLTLIDAAKALQHAAQAAKPEAAAVYKARAAEVFKAVSALANGVNACDKPVAEA